MSRDYQRSRIYAWEDEANARELRGKVAIANAKLAYQSMKRGIRYAPPTLETDAADPFGLLRGLRLLLR